MESMHLPVHQVNGKHAQMLIEELDVAVVDSLRDLLADLMRRPPLDHVELRPSVLRLGARRGTNEQVVLQLSLEVVLLDVIRQRGRHLPARPGLASCRCIHGLTLSEERRFFGEVQPEGERSFRPGTPSQNILRRWEFCEKGGGIELLKSPESFRAGNWEAGDVLRVANAGETGPADICAIGEVVNQILRLADLLEVAGPANTALEQSRDRHGCCARVVSVVTVRGAPAKSNSSVRGSGEKETRKKITREKQLTLSDDPMGTPSD